jgi:hypothetical protein
MRDVIRNKFNKEVLTGVIALVLFFISSNSFSKQPLDPTTPLIGEITLDRCSKDYQDKLKDLVSNSEHIKDFASHYIGKSYQKLAYAHNIFSQGSETDKDLFKQNLNNYLTAESKAKNKSTSQSIEEKAKIIAETKEIFDNLNTFSGDLDKSKDNKYLDALTKFSQTLEGQYKISDLENRSLKNIYTGKVSAWQGMVTQLAKHFHDRRFYNNKKQVHADREILNKKLSKKGSDLNVNLEKTAESMKQKLIEEIKNKGIKISSGCKEFVQMKDQKTCNILNPFKLGDFNLIEDTDQIIQNFTDIKKPILSSAPSIRFAGASVNTSNCNMKESPDGNWVVTVNAQFKNIQGGKATRTARVGDHKIPLAPMKSAEGKINQFSDQELKFIVQKEVATEPLKISFFDSRGNKMFIGSSDKNLSESNDKSDSSYNLKCNGQPTKQQAPTPGPEVPKKITISQAGNIDKDLKAPLIATVEGFKLEGEDTLKWEYQEEGSEQWNDFETAKFDLPVKVNAIDKRSYKASITIDGELVESTPLKMDKTIKITLSVVDDTDTNKSVVTPSLEPVIEGLDLSSIKYTIADATEEKTGNPLKVDKTSEVQKIKAVLNKGDKPIAQGEGNVPALVISKPTLKIESKSKDDDVTLTAKLDKLPKGATGGKYKWSCDPKSNCSESSGETLSVEKEKKAYKVNLSYTYTLGGKSLTIDASPKVISAISSDEDDDECVDDDPFDTVDSCADDSEEEEKKPLKKKYMPPMQKPMMLPPGPSYMTPGFN